jgi:hypothetical protein
MKKLKIIGIIILFIISGLGLYRSIEIGNGLNKIKTAYEQAVAPSIEILNNSGDYDSEIVRINSQHLRKLNTIYIDSIKPIKSYETTSIVIFFLFLGLGSLSLYKVVRKSYVKTN